MEGGANELKNVWNAGDSARCFLERSGLRIGSGMLKIATDWWLNLPRGDSADEARIAVGGDAGGWEIGWKRAEIWDFSKFVSWWHFWRILNFRFLKFDWFPVLKFSEIIRRDKSSDYVRLNARKTPTKRNFKIFSQWRHNHVSKNQPTEKPLSIFSDLIKSSKIKKQRILKARELKKPRFPSTLERQQSLTTFPADFLACHVVVAVFTPARPPRPCLIKGIILFVLRLRGRLRRMTDFINKWRNNDARRNDERSNFHLRTFYVV